VSQPRSVPVFSLVTMCLIWGYSWIVMSIALQHAHPFDFAAMRIGIGAAVLFAIIKVTGRPLLLTRWPMAIVLGLLQVGLFIALSHFALLRAGPGKTSVLVFTMPFWMLIFAHFLLRERMRGLQWASVVLAFVGLVLIVAPWQLGSVQAGALAVASGCVWAFASVLSKKYPTPGADPLTYTAWQLTFGLIPLALLAWLHPHAGVQWSLSFAIALVFSAIIATAIGWWLWIYVLSNSPAGIAGLNALGIPVVAVIASWIQLGERPPPLEFVGMALIGIALATLGWIGMRDAKAAAPCASPCD
jgi:drug/metabolite transporter (DMT)-like permease